MRPREREVWPLLADGKTDREIAAVLGISLKTVRCHVSRLYRCLAVRNRVEAAVAYVRQQ